MTPSQESPRIIQKHSYALWVIRIAKLWLWSSSEHNFMVGDHHNIRNYIKGHSIRKIVNHWQKHFYTGSTFPLPSLNSSSWSVLPVDVSSSFGTIWALCWVFASVIWCPRNRYGLLRRKSWNRRQIQGGFELLEEKSSQLSPSCLCLYLSVSPQSPSLALFLSLQ